MKDWLGRTFPIRSWKAFGFEYKFNSLLFNAYFILIVVFAGGLINYYGLETFTDSWYISCPKDNYLGTCVNPLYNNFKYCGKVIPYTSELCTKEFLYNGESLGTKPPFLVKHFASIVEISILVVFIINHFIMNKGFEFKKFFGRLRNEISNDNNKD